MEEGTGRGPDPDRPAACPGCGWQGPGEAMRAAGPGEPDPSWSDLACPRCGEPLAPGVPSVAEILAARRTPEA